MTSEGTQHYRGHEAPDLDTQFTTHYTNQMINQDGRFPTFVPGAILVEVIWGLVFGTACIIYNFTRTITFIVLVLIKYFILFLKLCYPKFNQYIPPRWYESLMCTKYPAPSRFSVTSRQNTAGKLYFQTFLSQRMAPQIVELL